MDFRPIIVARDHGTRCSSSSAAQRLSLPEQPNSERGQRPLNARPAQYILAHFEAGSSLNGDFITAPFNHPGLS
jgi:hypothetical protein